MTDPILVIGNVNADLVIGPLAPWPAPGTEVLLPEGGLRVGGGAGNTGLALAALGHPFRIAASRGDDVLGHWLAKAFGPAAEGWAVSLGATTISVGITHPDGERTFFTAPGHLGLFALADVLAQLPPAAALGQLALLTGTFVCPRLLDRYDALIDELAGRGFRIALDTGWPDGGWTEATRAAAFGWLRRTDHLLLNESEALGLSAVGSPEAAARVLLAAMPAGATVAVKCGRLGALVATEAGMRVVSAPSVRVIDTIGAGDCFNAGYLVVVARGGGFVGAAEAGVAVASAAISTLPRTYGRIPDGADGQD